MVSIKYVYFFPINLINSRSWRCPILFCIEQFFSFGIPVGCFPCCPVYFLIIFLIPYLIPLLQQTIWLFFRDMIKGILLSILLGPPIVSAIIIIVQVNLCKLVVLVYIVHAEACHRKFYISCSSFPPSVQFIYILLRFWINILIMFLLSYARANNIFWLHTERRPLPCHLSLGVYVHIISCDDDPLSNSYSTSFQ